MSRSTECIQYRLAASAQLDGEDGAGLLRSQNLGPLEAHLTGCPACTTWVSAATTVTRRMRIGTAEQGPDLSRSILEAIAAEPTPAELTPAQLSQGTPALLGTYQSSPVGASGRPGRLLVALRIGLVAVALGQVALAVPSLLFGEFAMQSAVHVARETGAWNLALAVGFAAAALHPRLAAGLATVLGTFVGVLVAITLFDLGAGHVHVDRAASHLIAITGLTLVLAVVRCTSDRPRTRWSAPVAVQPDPWHAAA